MIKHIEQCSECMDYVEGKAQLDISRIAIRKGASAGINKLLVWAIVTPIVSSIILPVFGTFIGLVVTFIILVYVQAYSNKASNQIDKSIYENTTYNFSCPKCGKTWSKVFKTGLSEIPDSILQAEKDNKANFCRSVANKNGIATLIAALITILTFTYCCVSDYSFHTGVYEDSIFGSYEKMETNWWWYLSGLMFIIGFFTTIIELYIWRAYRSKYETLQSMSLEVFMLKYFN